MTTRLKKPVKRLSEASSVRDGGKPRRLVIAIYPAGFIGIRPEGTRREELLDITSMYWFAIKQRVAVEQSQRRAARKGRR